MSPLRVTLVTTPEDRERAMAIRFQVFVDEQGFAADIEVDDKDDLPTTRHFLGWDEDQRAYVATARAVLDPAQHTAKIGRVAVLKACRGKQFGKAIMDGMEPILAAEGCTTLRLSSQYDKRGFYAKCGFARVSDEVYLEEGVEHCMMVKTIA